MKEKELVELKNSIDTAKDEVAQLKGQQTALMRQLKEKYGCKTLEEAEEKAEEMKEANEKLQKQIDKFTKELEEKYGD